MLIARIIHRVLARSSLFAVCGCGLMAIVGAMEGMVTGAILAAFLRFSDSGGLPVFNELLSALSVGAEVGSIVASVIGAMTGAVSFALVGVISSKRNDAGIEFNRTMGWALSGSIYGIVAGAICGTTTFWLFFVLRGSALQPPFDNYPWGSFDSPLADGFYVGVILGFILGTFCGAIYSAVNPHAVAESPLLRLRKWLHTLQAAGKALTRNTN